MTELNETMAESEPVPAMTIRDVVSYFAVIFSPRQIFRYASYLAIFLLIGYIYKLWLWFDMCVLESSGTPCRSDYTLFTMPFPIELGTAYAFLMGTKETVVYSRSFFALDFTHILCCVEAISVVCARLAIVFLVFMFIRKFVWRFIVNRYRDFKLAVMQNKRRTLVGNNK